jgi:predicted 2-oxoglutarate/Fe(II)-dependent dioxygenase YbiX
VLIVPRILEPELCRNLIAFHDLDGGGESGFMRDVDGRTVGLLDPSVKRRRDAFIEDAGLQAVIRDRLATRLLPEIRRAFHFRVTRIERYVVACYDAADQGFFSAHRDNRNLATAHRRFAVTINLNTGDYEGGELCFPEYGTRTYVAPPGGAVVFSCSLLHEARPVTRGRRYAVLPFLYDEEGERQRLATLHLLGANNALRAPSPAA